MPMNVPEFKSEKEEAEWWDAHPEISVAMFEEAERNGTLRQGSVLVDIGEREMIMLPVEDARLARSQAMRANISIEEYLSGLIHQALEQDKIAS